MTNAATGRYGETSFTYGAIEQDRLAALAAVCDPYSTRQLEALAPGPGWRCLDIGPGAGTITRWLASHVAPSQVVAIDRDTTPLGDDIPSNVVLLERDVTDADALTSLGLFDLVHARAVLMHLAERGRVLAALTTLVKPGGKLMITDVAPTPARTISRGAIDLLWIQAARLAGTDPDWARTFPTPLITCGLVDTELAIDVPILRGGSRYAQFMAATLRQLDTGNDPGNPVIDAYQSLLDDPDYVDWPLALVTTWGCQPFPPDHQRPSRTVPSRKHARGTTTPR